MGGRFVFLAHRLTFAAPGTKRAKDRILIIKQEEIRSSTRQLGHHGSRYLLANLIPACKEETNDAIVTVFLNRLNSGMT